jgi:hypothetical protein
MSRVWKRFLFKMSKGIGAAAYVLLAIIVPEYIFQVVLGLESGQGAFIGMTVFIALPIFGHLIYDMYRDSKREIESENRRIMRDLGGDY